jgi:hypothetical protein
MKESMQRAIGSYELYRADEMATDEDFMKFEKRYEDIMSKKFKPKDDFPITQIEKEKKVVKK